MSRVISVTNQKGGVGKTTTVANLGYALAQAGKDVLLIDFDTQASLTNYLNVGLEENDRYYGVYEMLSYQLDPYDIPGAEELEGSTFAQMCEKCITRPTWITKEMGEVDGKRAVVSVQKEFGFDLLPSSLMLSDFELWISGTQRSGGNIYRLYNLIQGILNWHKYDYVLIDCNPSLGIMAINAIVAATSGVLIPTNLDLMSTRGVGNLINVVVDIQEMLLNDPESEKHRPGVQPIMHMGVIGIVLNLYSERRTVDQAIQDDLERFYPFMIFKTTIPESTDAKKAVRSGVTYSQYNKKAAAAYKSLAEGIEEKIADMEEKGPQILRMQE